MDELSLAVPDHVLDSLPDKDGGAGRDMQRAVEGYEARLNEVVDEADDEATAVEAVLELVDHFEARGERFDELVPELRAWGQSPVYAIAWRTLYGALVEQLFEFDWVADGVDRNRDAGVTDYGIQFPDE